ncbi:hypothetical protein ACFVTF_03655 [Kitasatospora sp. NPDC057940]|uniref:hypothetical protein n=1 Tax=Kitasatospora sp. NPDC057940 TaxID=3346285 RepID=UPI0036DA9A02
MGTILKGVSRVRWDELNHAYGSAADVPGVLSRIAWGDALASAAALSDLALWIGELAVFDATAAVAPFLWDLAVTETVTSRAGAIGLLQTILEHGNPRQPKVQLEAHQAVLSRRLTADRLTHDSDPAVRGAAQDLLAAIDSHLSESCCRA